jgi:hypothetical protein
MQTLGIKWHGLRYHKRPSLPATVWDVLVGAICIRTWSARYCIDVIHARSHVPAAMALLARRLSRHQPQLVFDVRGLMVEEYEEAGRWRPGSVPSRLTTAVQRAAISRAARIVILTERARDELFTPDVQERVDVIPCCADLEGIAASGDARTSVRRRLGVEDATVMVYVGKFPSWSMPGAMADFHGIARTQIPKLHFLILTQENVEPIERELLRAGAPRESFTITSVPAREMGSYLNASDFAITFIRPSPATICQSPTKLGEYLGAGLPVVYCRGVGDLDSLMSAEIGVPLTTHSEAAHLAAARTVYALTVDPQTRERCRLAAEEKLSLTRVGIPRYLSVYRAIRAGMAQGQPVPESPLEGSSAGVERIHA